MKFKKGSRVHFVGIGGVGMSAAASLSLERGLHVSGCDLQANRYTQDLEDKGCRLWFKHDPSHVKQADIVVYSSAVSPDSPEIRAAAERSIPVYQRAIYTVLLMEDHRTIGITGSHGKTTTTWMTAHAFIQDGQEPSLMVGGTAPGIYGNFRIGKGDWFISEVDESDGTLCEVHPHIAVITNVDREHMKFYGKAAALREAFLEFCTNTHEGGIVILCGEDKALRGLARKIDVPVLTYGLSDACDIYASRIRKRNLNSIFDIHYQGETYRDIRMLFCGEHNILNSLAAFGAAVSGGIGAESIIKSLETCRPVARRFEMSGNVDDVVVINDYAHHPTEIRAVMKAVNTHLKNFRKIFVIQPHRYSRLKACWEDFLSVLTTTNTQTLIVLPVYSANEEPIRGISSQVLVDELVRRGIQAEMLKSNLVCKHLETIVRKGDCVLFLGAGDISKTCDEFISAFIK